MPLAATLKIEDTTIGWRFINARMKELYGVDSMPETRRERRR
ncbi:Acetyl-CoA acetyltransferase @ Beta-ketoadipyl CoA thiolase [Raoultella ornithinolytica]|nr:Acetyl-CoA acetyltransferase @ Beta-ketoadipyl CoA thiolase [Raoultella ornithinolytica]